jgi:UDP-2,4-diacetamido-2,4,6-trideoxy-beta-L-altropyranose hydrolase
MPRVVFRADASAALGAGHVIRCLALVSAFHRAGWSTGLAANAETFDVAVRLPLPEPIERLTVSDGAAQEPAELASKWPRGVDALVVDHYRRGADFEKVCRNWAKRIVVLDDMPNRFHEADILVNGGAAAADTYRALVPENCLILVGPRHAVIRPEFLKARPRALTRRSARPVDRILVSFGLSESGQKIRLALDALAIAGYRGAVDVVMPSGAWSADSCKAAVTFHDAGADMPKLMTTADLAIGAAGGTAWERCHLGLPSVFLTDGKDQYGIAETIAGAGAAKYAGSAGTITAERLASTLLELITDSQGRCCMAKAAAELVDGQGAERVVNVVHGTGAL